MLRQIRRSVEYWVAVACGDGCVSGARDSQNEEY